MKKYLALAMTVLFATMAISFAGPDKAALEAKEKAAWQSFKDKKSDEFTKLLASDFVGVYSDGIQSKQQEIDSMKKWDMKSFALSDFKVAMTDKNTAILTYQVKLDATIGGKDGSGDYNAASVWQMKNGEWHPIFHTDVKVEPAAK